VSLMVSQREYSVNEVTPTKLKSVPRGNAKRRQCQWSHSRYT